MPTRRRNEAPPVAGCEPRTDTAPRVGSRYPSRISIVVVLPAPLGPNKATERPAGTENETPHTASYAP